jgi:hypothetical protein
MIYLYLFSSAERGDQLPGKSGSFSQVSWIDLLAFLSHGCHFNKIVQV